MSTQAGVLFILDEVMTSRLSGHGLAHMHGLQPDLKTFGKWLGGGMAFGAFGGRADIMAAFDPRLQGSISHSGTFNNNTLVTHAGHTGLTRVYTPSVAAEFTKAGEQLRARLNEVAKGTRVCFTGMGTVMAIHIVAGDMSQPLLRGDELSELQTLKDLFWFEMLDEGFWIARRGLMALILHTPQDELDRFEDAVRRFIVKYHEFLLVS
jgi:glutamate-1-semialdehyde 2,1-aminomutase